MICGVVGNATSSLFATFASDSLRLIMPSKSVLSSPEGTASYGPGCLRKNR